MTARTRLDISTTEIIPAKRITVAKMPGGLQGLLALAAVAGILWLLGLGLARTATPLVVVIDGQRQELRTHDTTVGTALRHAGVDLYPEDLVQPGLDAPLQPGMVIQVRRAQPFAVHADGATRPLRSQATTVGELLAEAGIALRPGDEIWLDEQQVEPDHPLWESRQATRSVSSRGSARSAASESPPAEPMDTQRTQSALSIITLRRAVELALVDGGMTTTLHTTLSTVGEVLQAQEVELYLGDRVSPAPQEPVRSGLAIRIDRSAPVEIRADGQVVRTRTLAQDVAGVLGQEGLALVGLDRVEPELETPIRPHMTIEITRVRQDYRVEFDSIPFTTEWIPDGEMEIDHSRLVRQGELGMTKRRFRVVYENGQEISRVLEDAWVAQEPITKTMAYGTKIVVRTLETPDGPIEYWRKIRAYTVSYRPASCGKDADHPRYGYTRLGWKLEKGVVAVDPTVIPLRTAMYVPGYGMARAGDTGGGIKGKMVDLGFSDHDYQSWHWWTDIYLLTPVPPAYQIRWILPDYPRFPDRKR